MLFAVLGAAPARPFGIADAVPDVSAAAPSAASPMNANLSFISSSLLKRQTRVMGKSCSKMWRPELALEF
jgi:hypothetical protein